MPKKQAVLYYNLVVQITKLSIKFIRAPRVNSNYNAKINYVKHRVHYVFYVHHTNMQPSHQTTFIYPVIEQ